MEPLVYDPVKRHGTLDYAFMKPKLVERATKIFSDPKYNINFLKVEVPIDLSFVEGFGDPIMKQSEAIKCFQDASDAAGDIPLLYLSAGVSFEWFKASLKQTLHNRLSAHKELLEKNTIQAAIDFFALGLNPEKSTFWIQSDVPQVCESTWLLSNVTNVGMLERATSYKDKQSKGL